LAIRKQKRNAVIKRQVLASLATVHEQHSVDIDEDECVVALVEDNNSDDEED
jgi:hypothetical protein